MRVIPEAFPIPPPKGSFQILTFVDGNADHPSLEMFFLVGRIAGHDRQTNLLQDILGVCGIAEVVQSDPIDHIGILPENRFCFIRTEFVFHSVNPFHIVIHLSLPKRMQTVKNFFRSFRTDRKTSLLIL